MNKWLCLIVGSIAGGLARYLFAGVVSERFGARFPYGTLLVNVSGCLLIGIFNSLAEEKFLLGVNERILLMTGFCGAYTTFSTLILETSNLVKNGELGLGLLNLGVSIGAGFILFRLGELMGRVI
jgi:CrcB protein